MSNEQEKSEMTHEEKIQWMAVWCARNGAQLQLEGECGFGRECVGILANNLYPEYHWYDSDWNNEDTNGEVFVPDDAYHKHECVAVLGRGEKAESQLYDWIKWFDENGFKIKTGMNSVGSDTNILALLMSKHLYSRMVRHSEMNHE